MKNFLVILSICFVLLVSGCIDTSGWFGQEKFEASKTDAVVINSFGFGTETVDGSKAAKLELEIENIGSADAKNVKAYLMRISTTKTTTPSETAWGIDGNTVTDVGDLRGRVGGLIGGKHKVKWTLYAPKLSKEIESNTYFADVKVSFDYGTTVVSMIPVLSEEEYNRKKEMNEELIGKTVTASTGPVTIDVKTPGIDTVKIDLDESSTEFLLEIVIKNQGEGKVSKDVSKDARYVTLKAQGFGDDFKIVSGGDVECDGLKKDQGVSIDIGEKETLTLDCYVVATMPSTGIIDKQITIRGTYSYSVYDSTSIVVKSKRTYEAT